MANNDPLNAAGFSIPSLVQYQQMMRQQIGADPKTPVWSRVMQQSAFDASRAMGYVTPQERIISMANDVQNEANRATANEKDPATARLKALGIMVQRFNQLGLADLAAQAMPELNALQQRAIELRKLGAEATSAEDKALVDTGTLGASLDKPYLENEETKAKTNLDIGQLGAIPSQIGKNNAEAADANAKAMATNNEGVFYYKLDPNTGQVVGQTSVRQGNTQAREALRQQGWIEAKQPALTPAKTGDLGMPPKLMDDLATSIGKSRDSLAAVGQTLAKYNPSFLGTFDQAGYWAQNWASKLSGGRISIGDRANLDNYNSFTRDVTDGLSRYIQSITGAQMSQGEAERLMKSVGAMSDNPSQFMSKTREVVKNLLGVMGRSQGALQNGVSYFGDQWNNIALAPVSDQDINAFMGKYLHMPTAKTQAATVAPSSAPGTRSYKAPNGAVVTPVE